MTREELEPRTYSLQYYLMVIMVIIVIVFIGVFASISYSEARNNLLERQNTLQKQTEWHIQQSVILLDNGLSLFDSTFDYQLINAFGDFIGEYDRAGRDPAAMNLSRVKSKIESKIDGTVDVYIINENGVIEYTTFEQDLGLDFKQWPEVHTFLTDVRLGDNFSADRVVYGSSDILRKYAYMPTPDHRYLLEIGLVVEAYKEERLEFSYKKIAEQAVRLNPNLIAIRFFDSTGRIIGKTDYIPNNAVLNTVNEVYSSKSTIEYLDEKNESITRYLHLNLDVGEYASAPEMNMVAQIEYSTSLLNKELSKLMVSHVLILILAISTGFFFAFFASRFVSRPINDILDDVETIAQGNLDHTIRSGRETEFERLRYSINQMVVNLKESMQRLGKSEAKIKCYSENLEKMVNARTARLQKANEEMNIYLDIITRDINLSTEAASSYLSLLAKRLSGGQKQTAELALAYAHENAENIRNVEIIRRMYEDNLPLKQMDLNAVIEEVISETMQRYPEIHIHYSGTDARVIADELLRNVFSNLIENSRKLGGQNVEIWISARKQNDEVEVSVEDNGPGIPDSIKQDIFGESVLENERVSQKGLGLYVVQSIVEWYGGEIGLYDRIPGKTETGAAIRFTLKRGT